jgi:hypothetical protein
MLKRCNSIIIAGIVMIFSLVIAGNARAGTINVTAQGMAVNGTVTAKEILVTDVGWADYVFDAGYSLMPLDSVAAFIQTHKHLPGIPSEKHVRKNGMKLSAALSLQMQKIEELTLHMIELKKENDLLKARIVRLEKDTNRHRSVE